MPAMYHQQVGVSRCEKERPTKEDRRIYLLFGPQPGVTAASATSFYHSPTGSPTMIPLPQQKQQQSPKQQQPQQQPQSPIEPESAFVLNHILQEIQHLQQSTSELKAQQKELSSHVATLRHQSDDSQMQIATEPSQFFYDKNNTSYSFNDMVAHGVDVPRQIVDFDNLPYVPFVLTNPFRPYAMIKTKVLPWNDQFEGILFERVMSMNAGLSRILLYKQVSLARSLVYFSCFSAFLPLSIFRYHILYFSSFFFFFFGFSFLELTICLGRTCRDALS